jgi:hypothetical protein
MVRKRQIPAAATADGADDRSRDPDVIAAIGRRLQGMYSRVLNEPIPDDLMRLVEQLEQGEPEGKDAPED